MHLARYPSYSNAQHDSYEFLSSGPKGTIKKVVHYTEIQPGIFNLGFGDWDELEQKVKDNVRSNNSDRNLVLATVGATVTDFMENHPGATLLAIGETPAKTRLYQMGIKANWKDINRLYLVNGFLGGVWEPFEQGKNYEAFSLKAK